MFNKANYKMTNINEKNGSSVNSIGNGSVFDGNIITDADIRIDGTIKGQIKTKGKLVLGESGFVEGDIICQNAIIAGKLNAKINVQELLILKSSAYINGNITTNKLSVEPGAHFSGTCSMGASIKNISSSNPNGKPKEKEIKAIS